MVAFPLLAVKGALGSTRIMTLPSPGRRGRGRVGVWALALLRGGGWIVFAALLLFSCFRGCVVDRVSQTIMAAQLGAINTGISNFYCIRLELDTDIEDCFIIKLLHFSVSPLITFCLLLYFVHSCYIFT